MFQQVYILISHNRLLLPHQKLQKADETLFFELFPLHVVRVFFLVKYAVLLHLIFLLFFGVLHRRGAHE
jgi:hypothetical protein